MKMCMECKHYNGGLCNSPRVKYKRDVVGNLVDNARCYTQRSDPWPFHYLFGSCGSVGRFWEKKYDTDNKLGTGNKSTK